MRCDKNFLNTRPSLCTIYGEHIDREAGKWLDVWVGKIEMAEMIPENEKGGDWGDINGVGI